MTRSGKPPSFEDFDQRLRAARGDRYSPAPEEPKGRAGAKFGDGIQVGIEIVAGTIGGLLLGWAFDSWLGTRPLFLILFFVLGASAGMLNAIRWLKRMGAGQGDDQPGAGGGPG